MGCMLYGSLWLKEYEIYGQHEAEEGGQMVPVQGLSLEHHGGDDRKDDERNDFLNHFKLHQVERTAIAFEAKAGWPVLGNSILRKAIIHEKRMTPISGQWDDTPVCCNFRWPYQANVMKNVAADEQQDSVDCVHVYVFFGRKVTKIKSLLVLRGQKKRRLRQLVAQFVIRLLVIKLLLNGKITIFAMG